MDQRDRRDGVRGEVVGTDSLVDATTHTSTHTTLPRPPMDECFTKLIWGCMGKSCDAPRRTSLWLSLRSRLDQDPSLGAWQNFRNEHSTTHAHNCQFSWHIQRTLQKDIFYVSWSTRLMDSMPRGQRKGFWPGTKASKSANLSPTPTLVVMNGQTAMKYSHKKHHKWWKTLLTDMRRWGNTGCRS